MPGGRQPGLFSGLNLSLCWPHTALERMDPSSARSAHRLHLCFVESERQTLYGGTEAFPSVIFHRHLCVMGVSGHRERAAQAQIILYTVGTLGCSPGSASGRHPGSVSRSALFSVVLPPLLAPSLSPDDAPALRSPSSPPVHLCAQG